jgi:hypothetical protein
MHGRCHNRSLTSQKESYENFSLDAYALSYKYVNDVNVCTFKPKLSFYDFFMLFLTITYEFY